MKNAAIVLLREEKGYEDVRSCLDAFRSGGYPFEEVRFLYDSDAERVVSAVGALKDETENLVLIAEDEALLPLASVLSDRWKLPFVQGTRSGAGTLSEKEFTLFLLSANEEDSGTSFVKNACIPFLNRKYSTRYERMHIRFVGAEKAEVEKLLATATRLSGDALRFSYEEKNGDGVIQTTYDTRSPKMLTDDILRMFVEGLDDKVYALDETPLEVQLVRLLKLRGKKIAVAESFTGGGLARRIVSVPGASEVYLEGLNTYSERSKQIRLGVSAYTLNTYGAVSDATAYEMAAGLLTGDADIAIATTGLAGPKSDRSDQPFGLCFLAVGTKEKIFVYRYKFDGTREEITERAVNYALFNACKLIKNG